MMMMRVTFLSATTAALLSSVCMLLQVPLVSTFAPFNLQERHTLVSLKAEAPDLVRAYGLPTYSTSSTPTTDSSSVEATTAALQNSAADVSKAAAEASSVDLQAVTDFFQSAKETKLPGVQLPQSLASFLKQQGSPVSQTLKADEALSQSKQKLSVIVDSTRSYIDQAVGGITIPTSGVELQTQLPPSVKEQLGKLDQVEQLYSLPEGSAKWAIACIAFFVVIAQFNEGEEEVRSEMGSAIKEEAATVSNLAKDVKSMGSQVKTLNDQTSTLRKELKESKKQLEAKEKEISQERKSNTNKAARLVKEVDALKIKLSDSDAQLKSVEQELKDATKMRTQLEKTVQKVAPNKVISDELPEAEEEPFYAAAPKAVKKQAAAKAVKGSAKAAVAKAVAAKKAVKGSAKKAAAKGAGGDWSTLTQSALQRKTVKALTEYLESKGAKATDENGKPLLKALLVDAVRNL